MPRLVLNYMRPMAIGLLTLVSILIAVSYCFIPKAFVISFPDFYHQYWRDITILFIIATLLMCVAFYAERKPLASIWPQHIAALSLIGWFAHEMVLLVQSSEFFWAFMG